MERGQRPGDGGCSYMRHNQWPLSRLQICSHKKYEISQINNKVEYCMNPNKENNLNYKKIVVRIYKLKNKYMKLIEKLKSIFIGSVLNVDALASIK